MDLDPSEGVGFDVVREVAMTVHDVLAEHGMLGFPKTSGSRGIHVNVRIEPRWDFTEVRRAALALAREVERRMPGQGHVEVVEGGARRRLPRLQPERARPHRRQRLQRAARARRARLLRADVGRGAGRRARRPHVLHGARAAGERRRPARARSTTSHHDLTPLLDLARRDEEQGLGDAPWPPNFRKQARRAQAGAAEPREEERVSAAAQPRPRSRPPSANGGTRSIRSTLQNRPGSYQLAGRRLGSRPIAW